MPFPSQPIDVICEQCYQEFSLSHDELRRRSSAHQLVCPHCHENMTLQETISQKIIQRGITVLFTVNMVILLCVISSHLISEIGLSPLIGVGCVLLNVLMTYSRKPTSVRLISTTKRTTLMH